MPSANTSSFDMNQTHLPMQKTTKRHSPLFWISFALLNAILIIHCIKMTEQLYSKGKYTLKSDRTDTLNSYVKNIIIEQSPARLGDYIPHKVVTRTESTYASRDKREINAEAIKRKNVPLLSLKDLIFFSSPMHCEKTFLGCIEMRIQFRSKRAL